MLDDARALVGAAYDAVLSPDLWAPVLTSACKLMDADMASIRVFASDNTEQLMIAQGACLTAQAIADFREHWVDHDIHDQKARLRRSLWNKPVLAEYELVPKQEEARSPYVQEFLAAFDLARGLYSIHGENNGWARASVALLKSPSAPLASERVLATGAELLPHLLRAARIASKGPPHATAAQYFDNVSHAAFLLDSAARILWHNAKGEELLKAGVFGGGVDGKLRSQGMAQSLLQRLSADAQLPAADREPRATIYREGGRQLVVRGRLLADSVAHAFAYRSPRILIECQELGPSKSVERRLQQTFDLTVAESQVALMLSEDRDLADIAELRGVTNETVRSQTRSILRKVGVSRRAGIAQIVARLSD